MHPHFSVPSPSYSSFLQPSKRHNKHLIHGCCPCLLLLLPLLLLQHFGGGKEEVVAKVAFLPTSCMLWHMRRGVMDGECWRRLLWRLLPLSPTLCQEQNVGGVSCLRNTSRPRGKFRDTARTEQYSVSFFEVSVCSKLYANIIKKYEAPKKDEKLISGANQTHPCSLPGIHCVPTLETFKL